MIHRCTIFVAFLLKLFNDGAETAAYMSPSRDQQRFTIFEMAAKA